MHTNLKKCPNVLFVSHYLTNAIVEERGLPSANVSGSNRVVRLSHAMHAAQARLVLLSSASAMRQLWRGKLIHPARIVKADGLPVIFASSLNLRFVSLLYEPVGMLLSLLSLTRRRKIDVVMVYDYYPSTLLTGVIAKWITRGRLILDLEDICVPHWTDWIGRGDARPIQQLVGWFLMKIGIAFSDGVLVPSRRFIQAAGVRKNTIVVDGCIATPPLMLARHKSELKNVLVSGRLDDEQGVFLVFDAIEKLAERFSSPARFRFHICGFADDLPRVVERVNELARAGALVTFHGNVSREKYFSLLGEADICIAMQNPGGRHGNTKTPSKVYEYLAYGKVVVASRVGDFEHLPLNVISLCEYTKAALVARLNEIAGNWARWQEFGPNAAKYATDEFSLPCVGRRILNSVKE
jgi:glycosyltransferase involved in cell wall biosynthesis